MDMKQVYTRPECYEPDQTIYCPGCGHGISHRLVAEVIDEMGMGQKAIGVAPVGCSVLAYDYFKFDFAQSAHGRTSEVAVGVKRMHPDCLVFSYQGDGDLAAIGMCETVHVANRMEPVTVVFINNAIYGMTGGQMAPTTLIGQKSTTTPLGRDPKLAGYPIRVIEMLATLKGDAYLVRTAVNKPANIIKTKKYLRKAFEYQIKHGGYAMVEILSQCPTDWHMNPSDAVKWVDTDMIPYYPLGELKVPEVLK